MTADFGHQTVTTSAARVQRAAFEPITRSAFISRLLRSLCASRSLLQVRVRGPAVFHSTILAIEPSSGELILDELHPAAGHARLLETGRGTAAGSQGGIALRFELIVNSVGCSGGGCFYRVSRPRRIEYAQQREIYRVKIATAGACASISVRTDTGRRLDGAIHDLSADGVGVLFPPHAPLHVGQLLPEAIVHIDRSTRIECTVQIAFACRDPAHGNRLRVGACFVDLPKTRQARIRRCVAAIERAAARKRC